jgi:hypothetical protein
MVKERARGQISDAKHATEFSMAHFRRRRFLMMASGAKAAANFFKAASAQRQRENYVPRAGSARCKLFYSCLQIRSRWLVITVMKDGRRCERRPGDKVYGKTTQTRNNLAPAEANTLERNYSADAGLAGVRQIAPRYGFLCVLHSESK